ncbi:Geraniol 8-hydroxylase [Vitis vinifera]|uniref:Geraniol 8-hydroxylase n=1 Tax=Vitis vinifera TaxID=29760 RepID=A0A438JJ95_VITVI|nr:Geraniol 8-hydroxylase [Vitis vinifera]
MEEGGKPNLVDYFPVLRQIDPQGIRRGLTIYFGRMIEIFDRMIKRRLRLRKMQGSIASSDVLDILLNISEDNSNEIERSHMEHLLLDLFVAGTDTTSSSSTLEWAMAELLHNPEKLLKARMELLQTIGQDKQVKESDITRLPYVQAVVKETFRLHPAIPVLLPRRVEEDTDIKGFTVPKNAQVLVNAWAIGRDPNTWENSNSFVPERFLGLDMDVKGQNFELIPFGAGRRICPGLPLAIRMVHLMLASLIHSYDWKLEDGVTQENMNMEERFGLSLQKAQPLQALPAVIN